MPTLASPSVIGGGTEKAFFDMTTLSTLFSRSGMASTPSDPHIRVMVMGYGLWVMGYGLWVMGYGLWVMGYGCGLWVMVMVMVMVRIRVRVRVRVRVRDRLRNRNLSGILNSRGNALHHQLLQDQDRLPRFLRSLVSQDNLSKPA